MVVVVVDEEASLDKKACSGVAVPNENRLMYANNNYWLYYIPVNPASFNFPTSSSTLNTCMSH